MPVWWWGGWGCDRPAHRNSSKGPKRNKAKAKAQRRARKQTRR